MVKIYEMRMVVDLEKQTNKNKKTLITKCNS